MEKSILTYIKKFNNIEECDEDFDMDIVMLTNAEIAKLSQLGVGSSDVFLIEDKKAEWTDYIQDPVLLGFVPQFLAIAVRLTFDPPTNATLLDSFKKKQDELEYRIKAHLEYF